MFWLRPGSPHVIWSSVVRGRHPCAHPHEGHHPVPDHDDETQLHWQNGNCGQPADRLSPRSNALSLPCQGELWIMKRQEHIKSNTWTPTVLMHVG